MSKYGHRTGNWLESVINKIGGEDRAEALLRGEWMLVEVNPPVVIEEVPLPTALDWRVTYKILGVEPEEYDAKIAGLEMGDRMGRWTVPVLDFFRRDGDEEIRLVTLNKVRDALHQIGAKAKPKFAAKSWYADMDTAFADDQVKNIKRNDRNPYRDGSYVVDVEATVEPPVNANQDANWRRSQGLVDTTHLEDWLLELAYHITTGGHLNVARWTKSGGSRVSYGLVPCLFFDSGDGKVYGYDCSPDHSGGPVCARSAVPRQLAS